MLLDLNKLHGPREHVERTFPPSAFMRMQSLTSPLPKRAASFGAKSRTR